MQKAILLNPQDSKFWLEAGILSEELCYYEEAIEYLNKSISIDVNNLDAYNKLSSILISLKRSDQAIQCQ